MNKIILSAMIFVFIFMIAGCEKNSANLGLTAEEFCEEYNKHLEDRNENRNGAGLRYEPLHIANFRKEKLEDNSIMVFFEQKNFKSIFDAIETDEKKLLHITYTTFSNANLEPNILAMIKSIPADKNHELYNEVYSYLNQDNLKRPIDKNFLCNGIYVAIGEDENKGYVLTIMTEDEWRKNNNK